MSADSFLPSIVEVAVGIAGFAGIIAAIRQRNIRHWPAGQRILPSMLLIASAMAVLFSLWAALLTEAHVRPPAMWRIASGLLMVWPIGIGAPRPASGSVRESRRRARAFLQTASLEAGSMDSQGLEERSG